MAVTTRIPQAIPEFRDYINDTDDYLFATSGGVQNYVRLGLSVTNAGNWHDKRVFFRDTLYPKYSSENTRTTTIIHQLENFMDDFREFANPLLDIMAASPNAVEADETAMNFKIGREEPVHPTTPIDADIFLKITSKGQGSLQIRCRETKDATRASIPEDAKAVELRYKIGGTEPDSVDECPLTKISTKALFTFSVGANNSTKKIRMFARWIDTTNESRAGAWSEMVTIVIG